MLNATLRSRLGTLLIIGLAFAFGCGPSDPYAGVIEFNDDAETNTKVSGKELAKLAFQDAHGKEFSLKQYRGRTNVVLVVTRGYVGTADPENEGRGSFCTYCSTQAARLVANYSQFQKRDAEVLLVFPIVRSEDVQAMQSFASRAQQESAMNIAEVPFPVLADLKLAAVEQLGIRADLAKPATYILDKQGEVRFAYVGETLSDRPSIQAMLDQLDNLDQN